MNAKTVYIFNVLSYNNESVVYLCMSVPWISLYPGLYLFLIFYNQVPTPHFVRPLRIPSILVGDGRLGGISGTISAYESLTLRGYDVVAIVLEDHGLQNEVSLMSYVRKK